MPHLCWLFVLLSGVSFVLPRLSAAQSLSKAHSKALINAPTPRVDPCYRRLSSTDKLAAYRITIPPHGATLLAAHPNDYLVIALSAIELDATGGSGNAYPLRLAEREMQVMKGGWTHRLTNLANDAAWLLEIDVETNILPERALCGLAASPCTDGRFGKTEEGTYTKSTLFETPLVKLTRVELGPGGILEMHGHSGSELLIALTSIHITDGTDGIERNVGETQAYPAGTNHRIQNIGSETAQFLELEVK
jgi:quercetin dioxygenase-like cupin family protein